MANQIWQNWPVKCGDWVWDSLIKWSMPIFATSDWSNLKSNTTFLTTNLTLWLDIALWQSQAEPYTLESCASFETCL